MGGSRVQALIIPETSVLSQTTQSKLPVPRFEWRKVKNRGKAREIYDQQRMTTGSKRGKKNKIQGCFSLGGGSQGKKELIGTVHLL